MDRRQEKPVVSVARGALKERYSALEEGKADILAMYMIRALNEQGQAASPNIEDNYVTLLASMFRSVRFGATDSHGRANVVAFNFLQKMGAFTREPNGKYRVDMARMRDGADSLAARIIRIQGNGDYEDAGRLNAEFGSIGPVLQGDLIEFVEAAEKEGDLAADEADRRAPTARRLRNALEEMTQADFEAGTRVTLGGAFVLSREAGRVMVAQGRGSIIQFGSMYGLVSPDPRIYEGKFAVNPIDYGAAKAGVLNPQTHANAPNPSRQEVEGAVAAIRALRNRRKSSDQNPAPRGARVAYLLIFGISVLNLLFVVGTFTWGQQIAFGIDLDSGESHALEFGAHEVGPQVAQPLRQGSLAALPVLADAA